MNTEYVILIVSGLRFFYKREKQGRKSLSSKVHTDTIVMQVHDIAIDHHQWDIVQQNQMSSDGLSQVSMDNGDSIVPTGVRNSGVPDILPYINE